MKFPHGIIQGENTRNVYEPVLVASIQTAARRGLPEVDLLIIDEAHTVAGSKDYRAVMAAAKCPVIGLSATPYARGLGKHYDELDGPLFERMVPSHERWCAMIPSENPHLKFIDRAPYEIGHLLQRLPSDFAHYKEQPEEVHQVAAALEMHAYNAKGTILSGIEAIGTALFAAGTNETTSLDGNAIANLGCLVRHLSVELQYLIEIEEECLGVKEKRRELEAKKGGK